MTVAENLLNRKNRKLLAVAPDYTVRDSLRIMVENNIGAILIQEGEQILGIWTERDLMRNTLQAGFDPATSRVGDYMTTSLYTTPHDTPLLKLQEMYLGLFVRHMLIEKENEIVGVLSIGDVLRASLMEKDGQIKELNAMASWQYYENWKWETKKDE